MIKLLRYGLSIALSLAASGLIGFFVYRSMVGSPIKSEYLNAGLLPIVVAGVLLPSENGLWHKICLYCVLTAAWLNLAFFAFCAWRYPDTRGLLAEGGGLMFSVMAVGFLLDFAYRRWRTLDSPDLKLVLGTIGATILAISGLFLLVMLGRPVVESWRIFVDNWGVTLVILYLPLMGLAWFGYDRWRKSRSRPNPPE